MKNEASLYIDGKWINAGGQKFHSFNPATGEVLWAGNAASANDISSAVKAARNAFPLWSQKSFEERKVYPEQFAKVVSENKNELARLISQEVGKPLWESLTEIEAVINKVGISIESYLKRCEEIKNVTGSVTNWTRFKPHGVVAVLGPFNLPAHLPHSHIIPALLAGNSVIFKPSEKAPAVAKKLVELWEKTQIPPGVINLLQGGKDTASLLAQHPDLNGLFFTGSATVGKMLCQHFAKHPEKILALEMGGNNPLIVNGVKDLTAAAYTTIQSAFLTSGQRCTCARRLIVVDNKEGKEFLNRLNQLTTKVRVGRFDQTPEPFMGPVISKVVADNLLVEQERLLKVGGKALTLMNRVEGALLSPGIMDVTDVSKRQDKEIFGPFLQVIRVKDFDQAIVEANNTVYGLAAGLLSDNLKNYQKFLLGITAGIVNWNRPLTGASSKAPFGGVGHSGNFRPSAYFAADYCAYPIASMESEKLSLPEKLTPGIDL